MSAALRGVGAVALLGGWAALSPGALEAQAGAFRVLVAPVEVTEPLDRRFAERLAGEIRDALDDLPGYEAVDRGEVQAMLRASDRDGESLTLPEWQMLAGAVNAKLIMTGAAVQGTGGIDVEVRFSEARSGIALPAMTVTLPDDRAREEAAREIAGRLEAAARHARSSEYCADRLSADQPAEGPAACELHLALSADPTAALANLAAVLRARLEQAPGNEVMLEYLAGTALQAGRSGAAASRADMIALAVESSGQLLALQGDAATPEALLLAMSAATAAGDYAAALAHSERAIAAVLASGAPGSTALLVQLHSSRAALHDGLGDSAAAIAELEQAIAHDPASAEAHMNLGTMRLAAGDKEGAREALDAAVAAGADRERLADLMAEVLQLDESERPEAIPYTDAPALLNSAQVGRFWIDHYPANLLPVAVHRAVQLYIHVSAEGIATNVKVRRSSGYWEIDDTARRAALTMIFRPALLDGEPKAVWISQWFRFEPG